jgi:hypothetical protein
LNEILNHCSVHIEFIEILDSLSIEELQNFYSINTQNSYGEITKALLEEIEISEFLLSVANRTTSSLETFIETFPNSEFVNQAEYLIRVRLEELEKKSDVNPYTYLNESCETTNHKPTTNYHTPKYYTTNYYTTNYSTNNNYVHTNPYANKNLVQVNGYYRKDGTYVKPHVRTTPNSTKTDNLRYKSKN